MSKIHPADNKCQSLSLASKQKAEDAHLCPSALTVWKRSSMSFQGTDGFTVFDDSGKLAFRVDNYSRKNSCVAGGLVLMDGAGKALFTLKPQILSMQYQWNAYRGEDVCRKIQKYSKVFSMRRRSVLLHKSSKDEAEVFLGGQGHQAPDFRIEGSFRRRNCKIRTIAGELVAIISRKRINTTILLSDEVFSLTVQPGYDTQLIMAFVIILDRICNKPYAPVLCS